MKQLKIILMALFMMTLIFPSFGDDFEELVIGHVNVEVPSFDIYFYIDSAEIVDENLENFKVIIDGKQAETVALELMSEPVAYTLAIDISKSLSSREFDEVKEMLKTWILNLNPEDYVSLITFGEDVHLILDYESDKDLLIEMIDGITLTDEKTKLYEAIRLAHKHANTTNYDIPRKKAILMISDGADDYPGGITQNEVIEIVKIDSIPIYTIGMYNGRLTQNKQEKLDILGLFSRTTHGAYYQEKVWTLTDIPSDIQEKITSFHKISVLSDHVVDGSKKIIHLEYKKDQKVLDANMTITLDTNKQDIIPPEVIGIQQIQSNQIEIIFSEKISGYDQHQHFELTGIHPALIKTEYINTDLVKVVLTYESDLEPGNYAIRINNIKDVSENENVIDDKSHSFICDIEKEIIIEEKIEKEVEVSEVVVTEEPKEESENKNMSDLIMNVIAGVIGVVLVVLLIIRLKSNKKSEPPKKKEKKSKEKKVVVDKKRVVEKPVQKVEEQVISSPPSNTPDYEQGTVLLDDDINTVMLEADQTVFADDATVIGDMDSTVLMMETTSIQLYVNGQSSPEIDKELHHALLIGRANVCTLCLADEELSRQHAQIELKDEQVIITDLASTNGTSVNGIDIHQPTVLATDDMINMGKTQLRIVINKG